MPAWIRVRDDDSGHEYDLDERSLRAGVTPIEGYPPNSGPLARPRPAKHRIDKAGQRRRSLTTNSSAPTPPLPDQDQEQS